METIVKHIRFHYISNKGWEPKDNRDWKKFQSLTNEEVFRIGYFLIKNQEQLIINQNQ